MFYGYQVFTRHNQVWANLSSSWGFTVAPWTALAALPLVFLGWLVYGFIRHREWSLKVTPTATVDLSSGIAPELARDSKKRTRLARWTNWILDSI